MKRKARILPVLIIIMLTGSVLIHPTIARADFVLELDASYDGSILSLDFTLGASEPSTWANYLVLIDPTVQVTPLWTVPLPAIPTPFDIPIAFPFPSLGMIGIYTGLFIAAVAQASELAWVETDIQSLLPDTGIELCYDIDSEIACPDPGEPFHGQDAQYTINPMSFTNNGDGTVTDNVTGLMWQQRDDGVERDWEDALTYCEELDLAGHTAWRLPDEYELQGIVDYGRLDLAIDTTYFPGTSFLYYWSSSTHVGVYFAYSAWGVFFASGYIDDLSKTWDFYVRCVRGEPQEQAFTDDGDGTVTDNVTGLLWQQEDDDMTRDWEDALAYCVELDLAGHTDWRLPDIKELRSIVDNTRDHPAIDTTYFPGTNSSDYWSSSTAVYAPDKAWRVYFGYGGVANIYKAGSWCVRCVR